MGQNLTIMETDRLSEGLSSINMDMVQDTKGVYWPGFVALGAGTFAIFNFLTRWLLPGGKTHFLLVCAESTFLSVLSTQFAQPLERAAKLC